MATVCEPISFVWTRESYELAGEAGVFRDLRVELVDGEVVQMSPKKAQHSVICGLIADALAIAFGPVCHVRVQEPLIVSDQSEPEPDVAVVRGVRRHFFNAHPRSAELVVEISDTTLAFDRKRKAKIYAQAGIAEYWIANLEVGQIEVFRKPDASGIYLEQFVVMRGEKLSPLGNSSAELDVAELLPTEGV